VLRSGRSSISHPLELRSGQGAAVLMSAPAHDVQGRIVGVVVASLLLKRQNVLGHLARDVVGRSGHYEIVTRGVAPVYVVHPDPSRVLAALPTDASGGGDLVTRKPIRNVDWELRAVLPQREVQAPVHEARQRLWSQLAGLGVVLALLAWLGLDWLLRPLAKLHASRCSGWRARSFLLSPPTASGSATRLCSMPPGARCR
jgi:hypothetical protein